MKFNFKNKTIVRIVAVLLFLTFCGCLAVPIKEDSSFIHNELITSSGQQSSSNVENSSQQSKIASSSIPTPSKVASSSIPKLSKTSSSKSLSGYSQQQVISQPTYASKPVVSTQNYIVGYYTSWSRYNNFSPSKIDVSKLTHIHYAFADISAGLQITMDDPNTDLKNFEDFRLLKKKNSALKTIISVGGWDNSKRFSDAALTTSSREIFAQSCLNFILKHGFNGVDLDWEYPVSGGMAWNDTSCARQTKLHKTDHSYPSKTQCAN